MSASNYKKLFQKKNPIVSVKHVNQEKTSEVQTSNDPGDFSIYDDLYDSGFNFLGDDNENLPKPK